MEATQEEKEALGLSQIVTRSSALLAEVRKLPVVAASGASVLIQGETGTGKEMFARAVHYLGRRPEGPFVPVNCGAIPVELVENELFGHERAAFTGAQTPSSGLVAEAENGSLFLDEIDSLPLAAQVKLLRFLETKEYRRLGSPRLCRARIRVVAATNVNPERAVEQGRLRRDLYYRVNVLRLVLPPLRERRRDVPLLASHFLERYGRELGKPVRGFTPEALQMLMAHDWPGNVRELENLVHRTVILAPAKDGLIDTADVALPNRPPGRVVESFQEAKRRVIADFERNYVENLLEAFHGNISRAARAARKDRKSFWELIRKHHIEAVRFRAAAGR